MAYISTNASIMIRGYLEQLMFQEQQQSLTGLSTCQLDIGRVSVKTTSDPKVAPPLQTLHHTPLTVTSVVPEASDRYQHHGLHTPSPTVISASTG